MFILVGLKYNKNYWKNAPFLLNTQTPIYNNICSPKHFSNEFKSTQCKVAVFTGGIQGAGFDIAENFLDLSGRAIVWCGEESADAVQISKTINDKYGTEKIVYCPCDPTNLKELEKIFKLAKEKFKHIEFVVNSLEVESTINHTICANINSVVAGTLMGFKYMSKKNGGRGGHIINVSSVLGLQPFFGCPLFSGTKAFIIGFSRSMGNKYFYDRTGVKVFTLCPALTSTVTNTTNRCLPGLKNPDQSHIKDCIMKFPHYKPKDLQGGLHNMLQDGENGSVWVAEEGEFYKACLPKRGNMKDPVQRCPQQEIVICPSNKIDLQPDNSVPCKGTCASAYRLDSCQLQSREQDLETLVAKVRSIKKKCRKVFPEKLCCNPSKHATPGTYPPPDICKMKQRQEEVKKLQEQLKPKKSSKCRKDDKEKQQKCDK